jgi:hypothetical protein
VRPKPVHAAKEHVPAANPICPPQIGDKVTYIADPDDCNKYYVCSNQVAVPMHCPPGLYFCNAKETCDWPDDEECKYDCVKPTSTPVEPTTPTVLV